MNFILYVLQPYYSEETDKHSESRCSGELYDMINKAKVSKLRNKFTDVDVITDPNLSQVIDMIFTNKCIRQEIKNAVEPTVIPFIVGFTREMEELQEVAKLKLYVTGTEEEARDKELREAYKTNAMLTAAKADLEQQLEHQRDQLGQELSKKVATFEKYNNKLSGIKEEFQISIEKNV